MIFICFMISIRSNADVVHAASIANSPGEGGESGGGVWGGGMFRTLAQYKLAGCQLLY